MHDTLTLRPLIHQWLEILTLGTLKESETICTLMHDVSHTPKHNEPAHYG